MGPEPEDMDVDDSASSNDQNQNSNGIREHFKYFKRRKPPPDFSKVIDFDTISPTSENVVHFSHDLTEDNMRIFQNYGLINPTRWRAYTLLSHPGLIFIRNPFTPAGQKFWTGRCVRDLPQSPNKTNLDAQGLLKSGDNWWKLCRSGLDRERLKKLRWVTLGYHHNWDSKVYNVCDHSAFPRDLAELSTILASVAGCHHFSPEAAIVNFYHGDSTLAPHTDHSEMDTTAPLVSLSFGQAAVFLLGGPERADPTAAMFVRSGDVIVMSGRSRLSYHAVPRVLHSAGNSSRWEDSKRKRDPECCPDGSGRQKLARTPDADGLRDAIRCECSSSDGAGSLSADPLSDYLDRNRINVNVRQVFPRGLLLKGEESSAETAMEANSA